jgi:hypothetical protein
MSRLRRILKSYASYIAVPWRQDAAPPQRVVFCVYHEQDERRLRAMIGEFEIATRDAGHPWHLFDLTHTFPKWLTAQRYATGYYKQPDKLNTLLPRYLDSIQAEFAAFLQERGADGNTVVALTGLGTIFGFLRVSELVETLAPMVAGRLVVFFPGSYAEGRYRLLNAYDGWNYLATPITGTEDV